VVQIYALAALVICASQPIAALLQSAGHARAVALILAPGVAVGLLLIAIGVSHSGAEGGAWGFFASTMLMFLLLLRKVRLQWHAGGAQVSSMPNISSKD
jgi:O-antigen/teichoic acid export membrane protein